MSLWQAFEHRRQGCAHGAGEARRRDHWRDTPPRGRPLRPDQHADRRGVRDRNGVPPPVRGRRGYDGTSSTTSFPVTRARVPTSGSPRWRTRLSRHLPHGGDPTADWHLLPRFRTVGFGEPRRRPRGNWSGPVTSSASSNASSSTNRGQGHQLECHPRGEGRGRGRTQMGVSALFQGWSTVDQLAGSLVRGHAPRHRRRLHSIAELGAGALRLDANGFLGVESAPRVSPAWSEGHPLSEAVNHLIASIARKMGGFTFQELNLTIDDIKAWARGADCPTTSSTVRPTTTQWSWVTPNSFG